ncbi:MULTISPECIES: LytTR family DNA-binding domain-containing protein [unclassified Duganella]|jgi:two-component system LytT family response regulator|uniref:LytR/AlgR family response regulator transcription factor n=1 Tax=unclassified Duganella TaxID=2636909 RepID=UPI0008833757|nr:MULTISPECIES: LytTR family transcriptional regulator DNA-binding domain-containing protein [unclassified Duganella]SDG39904.1 two component transcriptional regulator, LytTR family [Duganella sp. OV458]SDJ63923.1 two component transcriptional regulator, LytTR family [Duganella sp. OV510]
MRIIIVDDEMLARGVVREYLSEHADVEVVAECANGFEAVKAITELSPDLVFLDIQMPKLDGFEVAELAGNKTRYIFATAFDQYAIKAFEFHALDYLLKPFSQQRFDQALAHARANLGASGETVEKMVREATGRNKPLARVLIRDGAKVHVITADKIEYIEAQDDYVQIRSEGKSYLKNQRMSELEEQLDGQQFLRIHRSYIVNIAFVDRIEQATKDSHVAALKDGSRLPISRSGYQKIRAVIH